MWGNGDERRSWEEIGLFKVFAKRESQHLGAHRPIGNFRFYGLLLIVSPFPLILNRTSFLLSQNLSLNFFNQNVSIYSFFLAPTRSFGTVEFHRSGPATLDGYFAD